MSLTGKVPEPSGTEGLLDVTILEALRTSYREGRPVQMELTTMKVRPDLHQAIERPPAPEPELVKVSPPSTS